MTQTANRSLVLSALVAVAMWFPTVVVPADRLAAAPIAVELA